MCLNLCFRCSYLCRASAYLDVTNPATQEPLAQVPLSPAADRDLAVQAAAALPVWRNTPPGDRIQPLFKLKALLEQHFDEIACTITLECGKMLNESRGEMRRVGILRTGLGRRNASTGWVVYSFAQSVRKR